jgi:prevent-host-death family protein
VTTVGLPGHDQTLVAHKGYFSLNGASWNRWDGAIEKMSAREGKNAFGLMIDTARAEPVLIEKHGRGVVMVISVEEYERLSLVAKNVGKHPDNAGEASKRDQ